MGIQNYFRLLVQWFHMWPTSLCSLGQHCVFLRNSQLGGDVSSQRSLQKLLKRVGLWESDLKCRRFVLWMHQYQNIIVHSVYINFVNWRHSYKARHLGQTWSCSLPADTDDPIADGWWRTDPGRCGSHPALVPSSTATGIMSSMAMITVTESVIVINNPSFYRGQVSPLLP